VLLNTLGKTRITSVKVLVNGKRLMIFHGKRLHKVRVSGLPAVGRHSIQIDAFSGRRAVLRSKYTLLACNWTPDKHTPSSNGAARPTKAHDRSVA
jgi:hypothetical protein